MPQLPSLFGDAPFELPALFGDGVLYTVEAWGHLLGDAFKAANAPVVVLRLRYGFTHNQSLQLSSIAYPSSGGCLGDGRYAVLRRHRF
ncbi:MAG: hypothetical protein F4Y91_15015 [Gemmatimonadetes bacterium]|nr:hypothetical protein [Gemmatimonadota bacterium]